MKVLKQKNNEQEEQKVDNIEEKEVDMSDEEIAEIAKRELDKKDEEIKKVKKELAKLKLLSNPPEEKEEKMSKEECIKVIGSDSTCNYDYAVAVVNLHNRYAEDGEPSPLGANGDDVAKFFADVIERCDGDKTKFVSVYQSMIAPDPKEIQLKASLINRK